jgi:hypothetical protein
MIRFLLAFLCLSSIASAQIELSYSMRKTLVGATNPEVLEGGRILIEGDSQVAESPAALIKVASVEGVRVMAFRGPDEIDLIAVDVATDAASKIVTERFLLIGEGEYRVKAFSTKNKAWDRSQEITIGKPTPKPPKPDDPPKPDPKPDVVVPNDYNVGAVALKNAPSDSVQAKAIAGWYRIGSAKLYGQGGLADIEQIKREIDQQFASKQCRDQATCMQWDVWKKAVGQAVVAEQVKRKTFTRQDWFQAMNEIATALESVR